MVHCKNTINSSTPLLFFPFLFCFGFLSAVLSFLILTWCTIFPTIHSPVLAPSAIKLADLHIDSLLLFSSNSVLKQIFPFAVSSPTYIFRPFALCAETTQAMGRSHKKTERCFFKRTKLIDSCAFALAHTYEQIPSHPFCITHCSLTFSQLQPFLFPSLFSPSSTASLPPSFLSLLSEASLNSPLFFFTYFTTPFLPDPSCQLLSPLFCNDSTLILPPPLQAILKVGFAPISVLDHRIVIYCHFTVWL